MNGPHTTHQLVASVLLTSAVLVLCSARAPLAPLALGASAHARMDRAEAATRHDTRAVRFFEKHRLSQRNAVVRVALAQVGKPYVFGGAAPEQGFDCSGLVRYVIGQVYVMPPRTAAKQARTGAAIRRDGLRPGDILAFGVGDTVTHVGIYVGDRKFVHASSVAGRVIVSRVDRPPSDRIRPLKGARRLLAAPESGIY
jgi:cell wall-associated NlpC family hydrolase